ncbi:MAG: aminopeptidase [Clostridia bacterium]|nr:aminopeptidase [Clostridia bacterium]
MDYEYKRKNVFKEADEKKTEEIFSYAEGYKDFLNKAKTERDAAEICGKLAAEKGYTPYTFGEKLKAGDKRIYVNHDKTVFLIKAGSGDVAKEGIRIMGAHVDSPRLDLKPHPLYEAQGLAMFKTHYYGGIKKYQWTTIPLALHGVIYKKGGERVDLNVGDDEGDPVFYITDLLPHLSAEQNGLTLGKAIKAESLNALVGCIPDKNVDEKDEKNAVKSLALKLMHEKYGTCEEDFTCAELCLVPAGKARDVGFDRGLISAYAHDDICCAYPEMTALFESDASPRTCVAIFADKEEVGSDGITGMNSRVILDVINAVAASMGADPVATRYSSLCVSADVTAGYDPNYPEVFEKRNSCYINGGAAVQKYTGSAGKRATNDAPAEVVAKIRDILDGAGVIWQTGELGKVDAGGGGTIAKFISYIGIETIDMGLPVLSMHAPYEIISKADLYEMHLAMKAFCK